MEDEELWLSLLAYKESFYYQDVMFYFLAENSVKLVKKSQTHKNNKRVVKCFVLRRKQGLTFQRSQVV